MGNEFGSPHWCLASLMLDRHIKTRQHWPRKIHLPRHINSTSKLVEFEQRLKAFSAPGYTNVRPERTQSTQWQSQLIRIEFPRMEVQHYDGWLRVATNLVDGPPHKEQRKQAEITASAHG